MIINEEFKRMIVLILYISRICKLVIILANIEFYATSWTYYSLFFCFCIFKANIRYHCCGSYCSKYFLIKCVIFSLHIPTMEYFYLSRKCYKIPFLIFILEKYSINHLMRYRNNDIYVISIIWCTYQSNQYMRSFSIYGGML